MFPFGRPKTPATPSPQQEEDHKEEDESDDEIVSKNILHVSCGSLVQKEQDEAEEAPTTPSIERSRPMVCASLIFIWNVLDSKFRVHFLPLKPSARILHREFVQV